MNATLWSGSFLVFLTALLAFGTAAIGAWAALDARKQAALAAATSLENAKHLQVMNVTIDGNLTKMLELTAEAALARGQGIERDRRDLIDTTRAATAAHPTVAP